MASNPVYTETRPPPNKLRLINRNIAIDKAFILEYQKLPILWDKMHLYYTNNYKRMDALKKLQNTLKKYRPHTTVLDVKKKINTLRTNYRREVRKMAACEKEGTVYAPKSWTFKYLWFLNKNNESEIELNVSPDASNDSVSVDIKPIVETSPISLRSQTSSSSEYDAPDPIVLGSIKCRESVERCNESLHEASTYQSQQNMKPNTTALYWTEKLSKLSNSQRIYAEKAINEILLEAELGNLTKYSVKINEGT